ncbi:hypothetical protein GM556_07795 [Bombella sp. ESL0378]|uniref:hypothetical protein n=1 Tax=Bombella sp. ESL0378 TaxID=2676442 RepID=UPI0012D9D01C|nr:hypothetical protein [Bombella sp. ESL0378]MUG05437.1 hypothetical protein [Bombella sp. ESL0378]
MITKKNIISLIWIFSALWSVVSILSWSHFPVEYREEGVRLTFNSMMEHMLHGKFDVAPWTVQEEGFLRDGRVYAYWGIFPAFLRIPILLFPNGLHLDITRLSSIIALLIILFFNYRIWDFLSCKFFQEARWASVSLAIVFAFSGEQVCFFEHKLYQEVCFWSLAFAGWFIYSAIQTIFDETYWRQAGPSMAIAASGALLTRVSMGIGLYAALLCFLVYFTYKACLKSKQKDLTGSIKLILLPVVLSGLGIVITAYVNYERWGNPLTFANYNLYLYNIEYPDRLFRTKLYGLFNIHRFYLGFIYFFFPIWVFQKHDGTFLFQQQFTKLIDANELPASSFFLTDGFMMLCGGIFLWTLLFNRRKDIFSFHRLLVGAVIISLGIPAFLMMIAISMNYRYRAEFYPDIILLGALGLIYIVRYKSDVPYLKKILMALIVVSVLVSNFNSLLYGFSELGPCYPYMPHGVGYYYYHKIFK